ncbi:hypothetical protein CTM50_05515 [Prevotella intermedia]|uniref:Uncharacterized protein n=1 Tax=Prevotella intermedia TaxID=28131 RepID=A0A2D3NAT4_PREIN|nr:hypothetical protein CTM50_05515 [Prevotella intermedia]
MHGKSGCFAAQNLRFRNVKPKLPFFLRIIFTKRKRFFSICLMQQKENHSPTTWYLPNCYIP